ncbi:NAD-dependent epimerase/dehydratase family protein [Methylobacterium nonmethylotrophicum]|uniref:NAD-dependent epimerase/dehydratase family protein n=1 Tax=Methylobacterium nonmethylotrophicum TaxID=1141884 RepID=A0A4Z0NHJ8_9HYPH|nr:NAD-dependent epimerase/dehydratase family protein [Methylobacterium nonmethylotrophicum]TGD95711.1 NAD-dependent epimerase/dehydratase family protein [Methylobacterium nonmethylotrophicum]
MRILITGGGGFIGTHLAERLSSQAELVLLDNFRRNSLRYAPKLADAPGVRVVEADVLDAAAMREAARGVDAIIHLAAIAGVSSYDREPLRTLRVNILGTVNLLEACVAGRVGRFIDFSTSEVFGPDADGVTEEDRHGIGPVSQKRWVYATSKLASEHFTLRYGEAHGFAATCVRPFNVYGPRQTGEGAIGNFCRAALAGTPLLVEGDGTAVRSWCYVSDMVSAVEAILHSPAAAGQVFNIGNPAAVETTAGLAGRIARLAGGAEIRRVEMRGAEVHRRIPAIDKAQRVLDFQPRVGLDEGLSRTLDWFRSADAGEMR